MSPFGRRICCAVVHALSAVNVRAMKSARSRIARTLPPVIRFVYNRLIRSITSDLPKLRRKRLYAVQQVRYVLR